MSNKKTIFRQHLDGCYFNFVKNEDDNFVVNTFSDQKKRKFLGLLNLQIFPNPTNLFIRRRCVLKSYSTMGYILRAQIFDTTENRK